MLALDEFHDDFENNIHVFLELVEMCLENLAKVVKSHIFCGLDLRIEDILQNVGLVYAEEFPIDQWQMLIFYLHEVS